MDDRDIAAAIVAGDANGIAYAYDKHASVLHGYCRWMAPEPADVSVPVQDTFIVAVARLSGLRDPRKLRPWLYAVARNECRRLPRQPVSRPVTLREVKPHRPAAAGDGAALARALDELDPGEREVMELNLRHHLAGSDLAAVLGVSRHRAHALVSQARGRLEELLGGPLDKAALARPAVPPRALREETLRSCAEATTEAAAYREWVTRRAGRFGPDGFPRPVVSPRRVLAVTGVAAAAAILIAVASAGIVTMLTLTGAHTPRSVDAIAAAGGPPDAGTGVTQNVTATRGASATRSEVATPGPSASAPPGRGQPSAGGMPMATAPPTPQPSPSPSPAPSPSSPAQPRPSSSPSPSPTTVAPAVSPSTSAGLPWPSPPQSSTTFP